MQFLLALTILLGTVTPDATAFSVGRSPRSAATVAPPLRATTAAPLDLASARRPANPSIRHRRPNTALMGILDEIESDAYDLMNTSEDGDEKVNLDDAYEMFLADLVFSTNDPRMDIINKWDFAGDQAFITFLETKVEKSRDPEERIALRDLHEMILEIQTRMEVNRLAEERETQDAAKVEDARVAQAVQTAKEGQTMTNADVLKKANLIQTAEISDIVDKKEEVKKSFYEEDITQEIRLSYEGTMKKVMPPYPAGDTPASIVFKYYDQFDAQMVKLLAERVNKGDEDAEDAKALTEALAGEQQKRITVATESLKAVLAAGDPMRMEGTIVKFAREGKIDEAFLLLLEANENQARAAGASGPADLMAKLRRRAMDEKDKQSSSKEIRLIRQLLRTDDAVEREKLLEDAFTPKDALIVPGTPENTMKAMDGEVVGQEQAMPEVPPPDFINACKAVLLNFGNLGSGSDDRGDLASRIKRIASEAEVVATRIYGKGMTLREQQDKAWEDQTTSIFDLERMEIEAERMGEEAPWSNPDMTDDMLMPGFDSSGKMQIGGN